MGIFRRAHRAQHGQVILFAALILPVLLGMTALAIDVGGYADDKRTLQNAADAIALAAAHDMCTPDPHSCSDTSAATTAANAYAQSNNVDTSKMTVTFLGGNTAPKVRVTITTNHRFAFIRILGVNSKDVSATAASVKVSPGGIPGVLPFGVTQNTLDAAGSGNDVVLKYDASGNPSPGNFGAIDVDGSGASTYRTDLKYGSPSTTCSTAMANCNQATCAGGGSYPGACAEDAPSCDGPVCSSESGNMIGPTGDGIDFRLQNTSAACDTFDEVFSAASAQVDETSKLFAERQAAGGRLFSPPLVPKTSTPTAVPPTATNTPVPPTATPISTNTPVGSPTPIPSPTIAPTSTPAAGGSGKYNLNPACNPWAGGACPSPDDGSPCSRRVVVVPIIDGFSNGKKPVTILGYALFFLEGFANGSTCTGNDCQVLGRFVKADVSLNALAGVYDPDSSIQYEKLVE